MWICEDCGAVFDEAKIIEEHHPYGMTYATEYWAACPHCESTNIEEARFCERCERYVVELQDGELCDVCYEDMYGEE